MTPLIILAAAELVVILGGVYWGFWLLDKLDSERRHARGWQEECAFWQRRAQRGVWHTCGCKKGGDHAA